MCVEALTYGLTATAHLQDQTNLCPEEDRIRRWRDRAREAVKLATDRLNESPDFDAD